MSATRYEAASAQLDALVLSVAQATVEMLTEEYAAPWRLRSYRKAIAEAVLEQTVGCAREDPDSEYRRVLEAMGARDG